MATETAPSTKLGAYNALSTVHHIGPGWKKGEKRHYRKGEKLRLSDEHAQPLLANKAIEPAK